VSNNNFAPDYVDVAARLAEFRGKHPEGSLQPADISSPYQIVTVKDDCYVVVVAAAYRSPDDPRPGIGMAYEPYPGKTPYTRGSELQNAETSAWGRAIVASLAADTKKGVASADEVRNRQADRDEDARPAAPVDVVRKVAGLAGIDAAALDADIAARHGGLALADLSADELRAEYKHYLDMTKAGT
jgi:hypothetical protein